MLTRLKYFAVPIGIAISFGIAFLFVESSERFQNCIEEGQQKADQKSSQNQITDIVTSFIIRKRCLGDYVEANANGIIALFTIILAGSTWGLWSITRQGLRVQSEETKIIQRAYLSVDSGGVTPLVSIGTSVAHIVVKNVGNLPARNVSWFIDVKFSQDGQLNDFPIDRSEIYGNNVIPPGTEMRRSQNFRAVGDKIFTLGVEETHLYVWGEIFYHDGFGKGRSTKFCHRYSGGVQAAAAYNFLRADSMRYHQYGNDAD
jgi:hypothetical protein